MFSKFLLGFLLVLSVAEARGQGPLPEDVKASAAAIATTLKVKVVVDDWAVKEYPAKVRRFLSYLESKRFLELFPEINTKCAWKIDEIKVSTGTALYSNMLRLDATDSALPALLERRPEECVKIRASMAELAAVAGGLRATVDEGEILTGRIRSARVEAWVSQLKAVNFVEVLRSYESSCRRPIKEFRLDTLTSYYGGRSALFQVDVDDSPKSQIEILKRTTRECEKILPELYLFNTEFAVEYGVVFNLDVDKLANRDVTVEGVLNWLNYYRVKPSRIDDLKMLILDSRPKERAYQAIRACLGSRELECRRKLLGVSFNAYTGVSDSRWATMLFLLLGDFISAGLVSMDAAIHGPIVNIRAADTPHLPKTLD